MAYYSNEQVTVLDAPTELRGTSSFGKLMSNLTVTNTFAALPSPTPAPEPGPDWPVAKQLWGFAWPLHWLGLGAAFALMALNSIATLIMVDKQKAFTRKPFFIAISSLIITLGMTRALYLWIDPYESGQNIAKCPAWLVRPLFGIAFPCLTSAFSLIHLALLEAAKVQVGPQRIQNVSFVVSVIAAHFVVVIISDTTVAFKATMTELLIVCQSFFIGWGFLNSIAFLYSGTRVIRKVRDTKRQLQAIQTNTGQPNSSKDKGNTSKVAKITMITSALGFVCCALQLYSIIGVYGSYSKVVNPQPWPWWAFQTSFRLVELAMGWAIVYGVLQPSIQGQSLFWFMRCQRKTARRRSSVGLQVKDKKTVSSKVSAQESQAHPFEIKDT